MRFPPAAVLVRAIRTISLFAIAICVAHLVYSYAGARAQAPRDEERIAELQELTQQDSAYSPVLAAEHDRITNARQARKKAGGIVSIFLIGASALFLASAKWLISQQPRKVVANPKLVKLEAQRLDLNPEASVQERRAAAPTIDLAFVDEVIFRVGNTREAAIPILQAIQSHYRYLPDEALQRVCERTDITPAQIAGTSSFYAQFRRSPVGEHVVRVCHGTACHVSGARQITEELRRHLGIPQGEDTDPDRMFTIDEVACLGCCSLAPVMMIDDHTAGRLTPGSACEALDAVDRKEPV